MSLFPNFAIYSEQDELLKASSQSRGGPKENTGDLKLCSPLFASTKAAQVQQSGHIIMLLLPRWYWWPCARQHHGTLCDLEKAESKRINYF